MLPQTEAEIDFCTESVRDRDGTHTHTLIGTGRNWGARRHRLVSLEVMVVEGRWSSNRQRTVRVKVREI